MAKRTTRPGLEPSQPDEDESSTAYNSMRFSYRNRAGQTGLDPMDTYHEAGYAQGVILRDWLTGRLRTRNSFALLLMIALGGLMMCPAAAALSELFSTGSFNLCALSFFIPMAWLGWMLLVNVYLSLAKR